MLFWKKEKEKEKELGGVCMYIYVHISGFSGGGGEVGGSPRYSCKRKLLGFSIGVLSPCRVKNNVSLFGGPVVI